MPSYKLNSSCSKPDKTSRKHSRKLLVKQFGGGSISKNGLYDFVINNIQSENSKNLKKLSDDVITVIPDLARSGYTHLPKTKYVVIQQTTQKRQYNIGKPVTKQKIFIVEINPKPTKDSMNVYFVDKTDDAISLTAGFSVIKKLTSFGKDTLEYKKFKDEGENFGDAIIVDIDGREQPYQSSSLYTTNVMHEVNKFRKGKCIHTTSGRRAATPHELKTLDKMKSVLPHSALVTLSTATSRAATSSAAAPSGSTAPSGAGTSANTIRQTDLPGLFPGPMTRTETKNISDIVDKIYDFINHALNSDGDFENMTKVVIQKINGQDFYLAKKETVITTLKNDYYILKKFYGRDDILVVCEMPKADADGNIDLGTPEIYEDSTDLVIDFVSGAYIETKNTRFNRSHVLLSCLKEYIKLEAEENTDQQKLNNYDGYYIAPAMLRRRTHLTQFFYITPKLQFNTSRHGYYYLYDINDDIYKILTDYNQHNQKVAVIVKINPNDKDMFFMENFEIAPNDTVLIYNDGTQPNFPYVEPFATGPPYSSIFAKRIR